jgi:hypothetical protein
VGAERETLRDGRFDEGKMSAALIAHADVLESARRQFGTRDVATMQAVILERMARSAYPLGGRAITVAAPWTSAESSAGRMIRAMATDRSN